MVCRLCLIEGNKSVAIFSKEKVQKCIMEYLKLELFPEDPVSKVICILCWQQLENFQNFHFRIEEAQKTLTIINKTLKAEVNDTEKSFGERTPFERVETESSIIQLKEEDLVDKSDDDHFDASDTFHCKEDELLKVELHYYVTQGIPTAESSETNDTPTRRITRGSKLRSQSTVSKTVPVVKLGQKPDRPRIEKIKEQQSGTKEEKITKRENDSEDNKDSRLDIITKRKRGRPKKGDKRETVVKVRSEKTEKIMETAKEFDEIIQKNMNLSCNICTANLVNFAELKRHFRSVHNRKGYAVCCNKRLYKRGLVVDHINTHINPEYFKCPECAKVMADRMCLRNHVLLMHQNEVDKLYQCPYCPKKYAKQYLLDCHQVKHVPQEECAFMCSECERGFPTKTTLTKHLNQIHSTIYDKMCEICAKLIRGNAAFERHMDEHEGIVRPQVQCEICGSWLKDKNSLRKHMYKHDGKTYPCNMCGKIAPSKSALQSHHRYVHQTVRQFHCSFCDKSFKKAINLREHLTTHTGEVLYTCPHCPKTFNSKANMHSHRKKKHRQEWEANRRYHKQVTSTEINSVHT